MTTNNKPIGEITRGKTARNRLRRADNFLLLYNRHLLTRNDGDYRQAKFVDLGYGTEPYTTLESAARLRKANPQLQVLGVEIKPERVQSAKPFEDQLTQFRLGGFNLPLKSGETVRTIRAFNVLRQYEEDEVGGAHAEMGKHLLPGGLLMEGTSDPFGRVWVTNLLRKTTNQLLHESLLFSTNFRWGFSPSLFKPVLPKNLIHRVHEGEWIYEFFNAWKIASLDQIALKDVGLKQWFIASAKGLANLGYDVDLRKKMLEKGYLLVKIGGEIS